MILARLCVTLCLIALGRVQASTHASITPIRSLVSELYPPTALRSTTSANPVTLESVQETGIPSDEVLKELLELHGDNVLPEPKTKSIWRRIADEFKDPLVQILLVVAVISGGFSCFEVWEQKKNHPDTPVSPLKSFIEPLVIVAILAMNAFVSIKMQMNADNNVSALKKLNPSTATLVRFGNIVSDVPASSIVPGDVILLKTGDKVPADCRVIKINGGRLGADEAALTGEPETVEKSTSDFPPAPVPPPLQFQSNMLFSGTLITAGSCVAIATSTGEKTEIGKISMSVEEAKEEETKTPLNEKLDKFSGQLTKLIAGICIACFIVNIRHFNDDVFDNNAFKGAMYYLKVAVALGVAAIPEGLPAVITLCLSMGSKRMAEKNVIVRKLPSVETLGCTSVICSDKTGTLTTNKMTAVKIAILDEQANELEVKDVIGEGYDPNGEVQGITRGDCWDGSKSLNFDFCQVASLCSDAKILYNKEIDDFERVGEPTEAALAVLTEKLGSPASSRPESADVNAKRWADEFERAATLEFNRDRKSMGVLVRSKSTPNAPTKLLVKGAPSSVIERCTHAKLPSGKVVPITPELRAKINDMSSNLARQPLRTLALATKTALPKSILSYMGGPNDVSEHPLLGDASKFASIESGMTFVGLCGIKDPARPEVADAIAKCTKAGIRVMMITGDAKDTAIAIARDVNIFTKENVENGTIKAFEGREFFELPEATQLQILKMDNIVFCRTEPADKQKLVKMLQQLGEITAMTGDGVNDAPALQQASIGVAMGVTGTEVAKEAADMILVDDNFATIVSAVEEGRSIYACMQAFICFLISCNIGEIFCVFIASFLGLPEPLTAMHLLWVNLVTDGPPATALSWNPPDPDVMEQAPRQSDDEIMTGWLLTRYIITGCYVGFATVGVTVWHYIFEKGITFKQLQSWTTCKTCGEMFSKDGKMVPQTLALTTLVCLEMFKALSAVSVDNSLIVVPSWKNGALLIGVALPTILHCAFVNSANLGIGGLGELFGMAPLSKKQWLTVLKFSAPIIVLDELLKFVGRRVNKKNEVEKAKKKQKALME